ncbi:hypothetical protein BRC2024_OFSGVTRC_CDS_0065 [Acinetobacter phage vB_AbaM_Rocket]
MNLLKFEGVADLYGHLNTELPKHIPKLAECLNDSSFNQWYWDKFCKYTQKVYTDDLKFLVDNVNKFLTEQEAKKPKLELNKSIDELKQCCDDNGGDLSEVLVLTNGRHFVVSVDSFTDCMNDTLYAIDSRYGIRFKDVEGWFLLRA